MNLERKSGFTLFELLIATVIVALVAALAVPRFYARKERAVATEAITMLAAIRQGELAYKRTYGNYAGLTGNTDPNWTLVEMNTPGTGSNVGFDYTVDTTPGAEKIIATRNTNRGGTRYSARYIALNLSDGTWEGDHPNTPGS